MVTDRKIIVSNGQISCEITKDPYYVNSISGFDRLKVKNVIGKGYIQDGGEITESIIDVRDITISGQIRSDTTYGIQKLRDNLLQVFRPKTDIQIVHSYGGVRRMIMVRAESTPRFKFTDITKIQKWEVDLQAADPLWQDETESVVYIADTKRKFHFPLIIPQNRGTIFGIRQQSAITVVRNESCMDIGFKIIFEALGDVENPQIFNINTRESLKLICIMKAGDKITVQGGRNKKVILEADGTVTNYIGHVDLAGGNAVFPLLHPGDNVFRLMAERGENLLEGKLYFRNRYLGV